MSNSQNHKNDERQNPSNLIGGYASGNLSGEEKKALYEASLQDQQVFDALMEDQALKDLLDEPGVKRELIEALQTQPSLWVRIKGWMSTPVAWAAAGALTATAAVVLIMTPRFDVKKAPVAVAVNQPARDEAASAPPAQAAQKAVPLTKPKADAAPEMEVRRRIIDPKPSPAPASLPVELDALKQRAKTQDAPLRTERAAEPSANESQLRKESPAKPNAAGGAAPAVAELKREDAKDLRDKAAEVAPAPKQQAAQTQQQAAQTQQPMQAQQATSLPPAPSQQQSFGQSQGRLAQQTAVPSTPVLAAIPVALDYALVRSQDALYLEVRASDDGLLSLYRRSENGVAEALVNRQPLIRGALTRISPPLTENAATYTLQFQRNNIISGVSVLNAPQGFRSSAAKAKRAGIASSADSARQSAQKKAALEAGKSGRVTADSSNADSLSLELTIPRPQR